MFFWSNLFLLSFFFIRGCINPDVRLGFSYPETHAIALEGTICGPGNVVSTRVFVFGRELRHDWWSPLSLHFSLLCSLICFTSGYFRFMDLCQPVVSPLHRGKVIVSYVVNKGTVEQASVVTLLRSLEWRGKHAPTFTGLATYRWLLISSVIAYYIIWY